MKVRSVTRFPFVKLPLPDGRLTREATCALCGHRGHVADTSSGLPTDVIARKFDQRGWQIGSRVSDDKCPGCVAAERAASKRRPEGKIIPFHQQEEPMALPNPVAAEPPRQPAREDRRRILDRLDADYDVPNGRYLRDLSDASVSEDMGIPRAWVADVREGLFGPDTNEASDVTAKAIEALSAEVKTMSARMIEVMDTFMDQASKLESQIEALKAGRLPRAA